MIVVAALETPAVIAGFDDVAMVGQAIEQRGCHLGVRRTRFDAARKRIYVICGEGYISVIQQNDPDHYALIENIPTITGARTGGLLGANLYVAVPSGATGATDPAQLWVYQAQE